MNKYKLFTVEHSYFSGKIKAYLRWKHYHGALADGYENILAAPELLEKLIMPKSGVPSLPQMEAPDGTWIQDTSAIFDYVEAAHPKVPAVPSPSQAPRQCLASYLIELLADEWLIVSACRQRWHYSRAGVEPSHLAFNEQQWGAWLAPDAKGHERRMAGAGFFEASFGISQADSDTPKGPFEGLGQLGLTPANEAAWLASLENIMQLLESHLAQHDYLLGGQPSLADFALMGPFYAHFYRDAAPGFDLRQRFPLIAEWVERTNSHDNVNARSYAQSLYSVEDGALVARPATSDGGAWLPNDEIPDTLEALIGVFFDEMWPVLKTATAHLSAFVHSDAHQMGDELPRKSFTASPGFEALQTNGGALTHDFTLGGITRRRMVVVNQMWMLQRLRPIVAACAAHASVTQWLQNFADADSLLTLDEMMAGYEIEKRGGKLFSSAR
jgi:glutathione S-transferase